MARDPDASLAPSPLYARPWFLILTGLALAALSWLGAAVVEDLPAWLRLLLLVVGLFTAMTGVMVRLRQGLWDLRERIETAAMIAAAGCGSMLAYMSMNNDWESGKLLFGALFLASLAAVVLVLLPAVARRVLLSLLLVFHFGGMLTAVTSVDPPGGTAPWVSRQLWTYVYRPYLTFLYLTNAYHFYSPDPGPPSLLWFAVMYEDGSYTWVKLPARENSPIGMHYQRTLALPEHSFTPLPRMPFNQAELATLRANQKDFTPPQRGSWEDIYWRRQLGSTRHFPARVERDGQKGEEALPIPMVLGATMAENTQYREPHDHSKRLVAGVAKRIFWTAPRKVAETDVEVESASGGKKQKRTIKAGETIPIKSVKMYRLTQMIIPPGELARGGNHMEKTRYLPYFLGEFDGKGELVNPFDPFLYWYIPIANVPKDFPLHNPQDLQQAPAIRFGDPPNKDTMLLDCLEMHAAGEIRKKSDKDKKADNKENKQP